MNTNLYKLLSRAQYGEKEALNELINTFEPAINKFSRHLNYPCAKTDLNMFLIKTIDNLNLEKFNPNSNGKTFNYIYNSIKNKKINLFNKNVINKIDALPIKLECIGSCDKNFENEILVSQFWEVLTNNQENILKKKFFEGYSDIEISEDLNISRQAVNRCKNRAFKKIKSEFSLA